MGVRFAPLMLFFAAVAASSGACAMNSPAPGQCRIIDGEKLPAIVGKDTICAEIARAMAKLAPAAHYSVDVRVLTASRLSAIMVVNGRTLPDHNVAVSDGNLRIGPIRRFAESLASEAAKQ